MPSSGSEDDRRPFVRRRYHISAGRRTETAEEEDRETAQDHVFGFNENRQTGISAEGNTHHEGRITTGVHMRSRRADSTPARGASRWPHCSSTACRSSTSAWSWRSASTEQAGNTRRVCGEGSTANAWCARVYWRTCRAEGCAQTRRLLVILDGPKVLHKAVRQTSKRVALIQRCQVHKLCSVLNRLPEGPRAGSDTSSSTPISARPPPPHVAWRRTSDASWRTVILAASRVCTIGSKDPRCARR